jgi:hypothetical protein
MITSCFLTFNQRSQPLILGDTLSVEIRYARAEAAFGKIRFTGK